MAAPSLWEASSQVFWGEEEGGDVYNFVLLWRPEGQVFIFPPSLLPRLHLSLSPLMPCFLPLLHPIAQFLHLLCGF